MSDAEMVGPHADPKVEAYRLEAVMEREHYVSNATPGETPITVGFFTLERAQAHFDGSTYSPHALLPHAWPVTPWLDVLELHTNGDVS